MTEFVSKQKKLKKYSHKKGRWSNDQEFLFQEGMKYFGRDWKKIQQYIKSRTLLQVRSYAQKYFLRLQKLQIKTDQSQLEHFEKSEKFKLTSQTLRQANKKEIGQTEESFFQVSLNKNSEAQNIIVTPCISNSAFSRIDGMYCNGYFQNLYLTYPSIFCSPGSLDSNSMFTHSICSPSFYFPVGTCFNSPQ